MQLSEYYADNDFQRTTLTSMLVQQYSGLSPTAFGATLKKMDTSANGLQLNLFCRATFNEYLWYLDPCGTSNRYVVRLCCAPGCEAEPPEVPPNGRIVAFEDETVNGLAPPDPGLLSLHRYITRVLTGSGLRGVFAVLDQQLGHQADFPASLQQFLPNIYPTLRFPSHFPSCSLAVHSNCSYN